MGDIFCSKEVQYLLKDKYIQIIGSSNWRSAYKDLITLVQETKFIETFNCKKKLEPKCKNDKMVEGSEKLDDRLDYK